MANWNIFDNIQSQGIEETSTTQNWAIGTKIRAAHATYGEGEFVYLLGVASTAVGNAVVYNQVGQTTRAVSASRGPVAFAMSANIAAQYGWYMVKGALPVSSVAANAANSRQYLTATAGSIDDAVVAGQAIDGVIPRVVESGGFALSVMMYPSANGNG